jgi:uncharacterized protein YfaQ (DUF2300 family)
MHGMVGEVFAEFNFAHKRVLSIDINFTFSGGKAGWLRESMSLFLTGSPSISTSLSAHLN